ncbi:MAG: AAA family ATPase [Gammaproteobacteria bacterium]|nr:AAA family ATPase [Gammaproteobacteria bacterium]
MIHRFSISNFQSIRDAVELDFRIPGTTPEVPCFRTSHSRPDVRLPSVIALVGPNGSGKSTLLRAIVETFRFIIYSYGYQSSHIRTFPSFLGPEALVSPTKIEIDFETLPQKGHDDSASTLLRYTLELERDETNLYATRVSREALYSFPKRRPRRLLEREKGQHIYVEKEIGLRPRDDRLSSIPENASAISSLARMGVPFFVNLQEDISEAQTNIARIENSPRSSGAENIVDHYREQKDLTDKVSDKLQRFDLGIKDIKLQSAQNGKWFLTFDHHGLNAPVMLQEESTGTRRLVHMYPSFNDALDSGHLAVMDSLDADFHTELSMEVLNWFRKNETNPKKAQLICALHNVSVLNELEKEEIFIVEKDRSGATHAYGMRDISGLRRGTNLQKQYRSGALGGLPAFG